jgi:Flp pilus assembly protein TadG
MLRRRNRNDRGAVATVFAILLAGGVLLGMLAIVVDVGQLYAEREELQSGADAAVIAIAEKCARAETAGDCSMADLTILAASYANLNAKDGASTILEICGNVPLSIGIAACKAPVGNLTDCIPGQVTGSGKYVEVRTGTRTSDDKYVFPPTFAQMLLGNEGYAGSAVRACARATWGVPAAGLAVTFSLCEWNLATANGTDFPDKPPYPPNTVPADSYQQVLKVHDPQGNPACPQGPPGFDRPGGFGWLDDGDSEDCQTDTFVADPGTSPSSQCVAVLDAATDSSADATVFYIPIYDTVTGQGSNAQYHIVGVAAFVPTGYFFGSGNGKHKESWLTDDEPCSGEERCIYGYFVDVLGPGNIGSGDLANFGATVVSLVG